MTIDIDIPLFKMIRQPVLPIMGSSVDAAPFLIFFILLMAAAWFLRRGGRVALARRTSQVVASLIFIIFLHQCLCMIRGWVFALKTVGRDDLMAFSHLSMFVLLGATGLVFGRVFCGWACPLGFFNELLGKVARMRSALPRRVRLLSGYMMLTGAIVISVWLAWMVRPGTQFFAENAAAIWSVWLLLLLFIALPIEKSDRGLKKVKYVSLAFWLVLSVVGIFVTSPWCTLFGNEVDYSSIIALLAVLLSATVVSMSWCRYLCPLGATLGVLAVRAQGGINGGKCADCGNCSRLCPMGALHRGNIDRSSCINCGSCVENCGFKWGDISK